MRKVFVLLVVVFLALSCAITPVEIAKKAANSSVYVIKVDSLNRVLSTGTGFVIDNEIVVTNVHVVTGGESIYVVTKDKIMYKCDGYVAIDKDDDLVILKVTGLTSPSLILNRDEEIEVGEKVYVMGNPQGFIGTFSEGVISGKRRFDKSDNLQMTACISAGSSGGAVLDSNAHVVGIVVASYSVGQNINFAIPVRYLLELIKEISVPRKISTIEDPISTQE